MERFFECAETGRSLSASSGERAAFRLALKVRELSEELGNMDSGLQDDFFNVLRAARCPDTRPIILKLLFNVTHSR